MGVITGDMRRVVSEQRLGFVATVCPDGTPNLSPKGTTRVLDDDHLMWADLRSPRTLANLEENPAMEINVVDPVLRKGYRFKGRAAVHTEGELFEQAMEIYREEGLEQLDRIGAVAVLEVERAVPLVSPAYDDGTSEDEVRAYYLERWRVLYGY
jgi:uncharacterized protein